jgi:hypothetical protein
MSGALPPAASVASLSVKALKLVNSGTISTPELRSV